MQAAAHTLAQTEAFRSKTPAGAALDGRNSSTCAARHSINSQHLIAEFDLEREISKPARRMRRALDKSIADSQNFKNFAAGLTGDVRSGCVRVFKHGLTVGFDHGQLLRNCPWAHADTTFHKVICRSTAFKGPNEAHTEQYLKSQH